MNEFYAILDSMPLGRRAYVCRNLGLAINVAASDMVAKLKQSPELSRYEEIIGATLPSE